jgi:hypothetical protein
MFAAVQQLGKFGLEAVNLLEIRLCFTNATFTPNGWRYDRPICLMPTPMCIYVHMGV